MVLNGRCLWVRHLLVVNVCTFLFLEKSFKFSDGNGNIGKLAKGGELPAEPRTEDF